MDIYEFVSLDSLKLMDTEIFLGPWMHKLFAVGFDLDYDYHHSNQNLF